MIKRLSLLLILAFFLLFPQSESRNPHPQSFRSFKIQNTQIARGCAYTVKIKTSCSSPSITRDQISIAFGDAYGNQIYAPRLDDPHSYTFERCSTDTFQIYGPCSYKICYLYLLRVGYDGWKPESVKIYGPDSRTATFYYDTFIPYGVWFGFNLCSSFSGSDGRGGLIEKM